MVTPQANPASDPRAMRRVIAEDPDWNLETVPPLVDICINHIVDNFEDQPLLNELNTKHKEKVLSKLSTNISLKITAPLISNEGYWERCCRDRWKLCDVSEHGNSWKTMFFQKNAQETIEKFVPQESDLEELEELLKLSSQYIKQLIITQLLPSCQDQPLTFDEEDDGMSDDLPLTICNDHLDCNIIIKNLEHLEELQLRYGVKNCGMNFQWSLLEFTPTDCQTLSRALKATSTLKILRLRESRVDNERGRMLISHLLDHPSLCTLDLSHNCLGDGAGRALGKLLNDHSPKLTVLDVRNNVLEMGAGASIGHALQKNDILQELNISMNRLEDIGVQPILKSLMKNKSLLILNISSNDIGEASAPALAEMLMANKHLTSLSVTCNKLCEGGGKLIQEGMEDNKTLLHFDLRLTGISQESEYSINQIIKENSNPLKISSKLTTS